MLAMYITNIYDYLRHMLIYGKTLTVVFTKATI